MVKKSILLRADEVIGGTVAPAGGNTCAPRSARLDLKAPAVPRSDTDHTGPSISTASMPMARSRGLPRAGGSGRPKAGLALCGEPFNLHRSHIRGDGRILCECDCRLRFGLL